LPVTDPVGAEASACGRDPTVNALEVYDMGGERIGCVGEKMDIRSEGRREGKCAHTSGNHGVLYFSLRHRATDSTMGGRTTTPDLRVPGVQLHGDEALHEGCGSCAVVCSHARTAGAGAFLNKAK